MPLVAIDKSLTFDRIDVKTPEEYEAHHIPGGYTNVLDYLEVLSKFLPDKDVAVICEHGNRASCAINGMPQIYYLLFQLFSSSQQSFFYVMPKAYFCQFFTSLDKGTQTGQITDCVKVLRK